VQAGGAGGHDDSPWDCKSRIGHSIVEPEERNSTCPVFERTPAPSSARHTHTVLLDSIVRERRDSSASICCTAAALRGRSRGRTSRRIPVIWVMCPPLDRPKKVGSRHPCVEASLLHPRDSACSGDRHPWGGKSGVEGGRAH